MIRSIAALLAWVGVGTALAQDKPEPPLSRAGIVLFKMPSDRQRKEEAEYTVLKPVDPAAKTYEIRIRPAVEAKGTASDAVEAHAQKLAATNKIQPATAATAQKHQVTGHDMAVRGFYLLSADNKPYVMYVWALQSGTKCAVIEFLAEDPKLLTDVKGIGAFVDLCRLAHAQVLAAGEPPLTVYDVEETIEVLQWLMDAPFTVDQREVFRSEIIDGWKKKDAETIQGVAQVLQFRAEYAKLTPEKQDLVRKQSEPEIVAGLRKETDRCSKLLVEIYDAAHKPIAEGDPALTRQQADSALELFFFMAAQLEGVRAWPAAADKEAWAKQLAAGWPKLEAGVRKSFAGMPAAWAATRAGWTEMAEAEREGIKKQFAQLDFIKEMRAHFAKAKAEAGAGADAAALQSKLTQNYSATSSLLKMGYDSTMTRMAGIMNMSSSSPYRYSYRPR